ARRNREHLCRGAAALRRDLRATLSGDGEGPYGAQHCGGSPLTRGRAVLFGQGEGPYGAQHCGGSPLTRGRAVLFGQLDWATFHLVWIPPTLTVRQDR